MIITLEEIEEYAKEFVNERANIIAKNAVTNNGILKATQNYTIIQELSQQFSSDINQINVVNQKKTGLCWMFAAFNFINSQISKKLNIERIEFSQNYLMFYDKLEKANLFLENILSTLEEPTQGRLISTVLCDPLGDGGQWDMFCNLVNKYGIIPKSAMPDTASSVSTKEMNSLLTELIVENACRMRKEYKLGKTVNQLKESKKKIINDIYRILCICLGNPPDSFDFELLNKSGNKIVEKQISPLMFSKKYISIDFDDYICMANLPFKNMPYYKSYTVRFLGNLKEGRNVKYLNLPIELLKKIAIKHLNEGLPVWVGCDIRKERIRDEGILAVGAHNTNILFDINTTWTKGERLEYKQSTMTHAMILIGVNPDENGKVISWKAENSWGKEAGRNGYYIMTDEWFSEYVYQIVVNKKYVSHKLVDAYYENPIVIEQWEAIGNILL